MRNPYGITEEHRALADIWRRKMEDASPLEKEVMDAARNLVDGGQTLDYGYYVGYSNAITDIAVAREDVFTGTTGKGLLFQYMLDYACYQRCNT
jgi:hypothetical protein